MTSCQTCHVKVDDGVDAHWGGVGSMGEELHYCGDHCPDPECNPPARRRLNLFDLVASWVEDPADAVRREFRP